MLAACGVLADGNRVLVHLAPRTRGGHGKAAGSPSRTCAGATCLTRLAPRGSKGPEQGRFGGYSRRSAGTSASCWEIQQVAPDTRRAFSAQYKLRDNGPNSRLKIAELGRSLAFKRLVLVARV